MTLRPHGPLPQPRVQVGTRPAPYPFQAAPKSPAFRTHQAASPPHSRVLQDAARWSPRETGAGGARRVEGSRLLSLPAHGQEGVATGGIIRRDRFVLLVEEVFERGEHDPGAREGVFGAQG